MFKRVAVVANCVVSEKSMGGGDRIFIELAKDWQKRGLQILLIGPPEARGVARLGQFEGEFAQSSNFNVSRWGISRAYLGRILKSYFGRQDFGKFDLIYSASEALPDVILSLKIKRQNPQALWLVGFFLRAPNPFGGEVPFNFKFVSLYLQQVLALWLLKIFRVSGIVLLGRAEESFLRQWGFENLCRIQAAADSLLIRRTPNQSKIYDACFIGRLSFQKGIDDLLAVWSQVVKKGSRPRLAIIGWGYDRDESEFLKRINSLDLTARIDYLGFVEGEEKFRIMKQSRLAILPSRYESFGLVFLEALACGLPVVAYDLPVLKENFPVGVVFVPSGRVELMADAVVRLLQNEPKLKELGAVGKEFSRSFSWMETSQRVWDFILNLNSK